MSNQIPAGETSGTLPCAERRQSFGTRAVPGVRKRRGGRRFRMPRTMTLRRQNAGWCQEEGELECRPRQRDAYLFHSRDGRRREVERSWKSQRRAAKAWDRRD